MSTPRTVVGRGVVAHYPTRPDPVLRGVDITMAPGRRIAVVGPSGAGKTSLGYVLVRFLAYAGSLAMDGTELRDMEPAEVRQAVGLVTQDPHLFDTTLATNVRIGRVDADDHEVHDALVRVGLGPWLDTLPDGLGSEVGSRGSRLSGGQRQRIGVARALLARFDALVVDEPTEHLDLAAADALMFDLLALEPARSLVVVTHRLAGLQAVDEILVLEHGAVVERGRHDDLLAAGGRYRALWEREETAAHRG
jgi:ABC-type multidrug transport system fused ATPase/permease subunit